MIKLSEILHEIDDESKEGLICIDDWRWPDVDHLVSMGFDFADDHRFHTTKEPKIIVYKKKEKDDEKGEEAEFFYVEEKERATKRFKSFNDVVDYFDTYSQPDLDKNI